MRLALAAAVAAGLAGCQQEQRSFRSDPVLGETREEVALVPLAPGEGGPRVRTSGVGERYENNAVHISQGQRFYRWFNCNGCHANGGGGMGPPLMDETWIYGGSIENIVATIREGRPNGMPSFRGRIPDEQIWQIAAYVRSMGRYVPREVAPGRRDHMQGPIAEQRRPRAEPGVGDVPRQNLQPQ